MFVLCIYICVCVHVYVCVAPRKIHIDIYKYYFINLNVATLGKSEKGGAGTTLVPNYHERPRAPFRVSFSYGWSK